MHVHRDATALVVRFHNPQRANAVDPAMLAELTRQVSEPPADARVIILTGAGERHFCSGLDLADADGDALAQRVRDGEHALRRAVAAIAESPVPVVAVVNGAAYGGGLELAISCDWRIAVDNARFAMPAARLGVVYAPEGMRRFLECCGPARTRQLFLTGRPVDAQRALAIGLVDEVVSADERDAAVADTIRDITAAAPGAVKATRSAVAALAGALYPEAVQDVERMRAAAYASPEFTEALAAFRERRAPFWVP